MIEVYQTRKITFSVGTLVLMASILTLATLTLEVSAQAVTAQSNENRLASVALDDFVIKPGQAQPFDSGLPPRSNEQAKSPSYSTQSAPQPTLLTPPAMPHSQTTMPQGTAQASEFGLTTLQNGGNAASGGNPNWQILQNPNGPHTAILFDPNSQVIAVYLIDSAAGLITLKSVRNIRWDLEMESYNSNKPAPKDIRDMLPR